MGHETAHEHGQARVHRCKPGDLGLRIGGLVKAQLAAKGRIPVRIQVENDGNLAQIAPTVLVQMLAVAPAFRIARKVELLTAHAQVEALVEHTAQRRHPLEERQLRHA